MNVLVVYHSEFGNTGRIARAIADALSHGASVHLRNAGEGPLTLEGIDLLVIGDPTQGHSMSKTMRRLLETLPAGAAPKLGAATFDTRLHIPQLFAGSAAVSIAKVIGKRGIRLVVPPVSFFVGGTEGPLLEGELERATQWGTDLLAAVGAPAKELAPAGV